MNANYYIERPHYMETLDKTLEYWTVLLVIAIFLLYSILRLAQYLPDGEVEVLPPVRLKPSGISRKAVPLRITAIRLPGGYLGSFRVPFQAGSAIGSLA
jgi:hypothetical protein